MGENGYRNTLAAGTLLHGGAYSYRIERVLGQGSFGITYLATVKMQGALGSIDANVKVAIKEFFMKEINGREGSTVTSGSKGGVFADYRKKFVREAANLSKLRHPNIIKVLECFEANGTVYYAMEYIDGGSLDELISKRGRLAEAEALRYGRQIADALAYMHEHNVLHLDLKPGNIMLREGNAVLIDFGLSKQYDSSGNPESSTTVGGGTPGYAPLEQASYHEGKGFPVTMDIYALGGTMLKMLTGQRPPDASEILNDGFPGGWLRGVTPATVAVVEKAMSPLRKDRYQSAAELIAAINKLRKAVTTVSEIEETERNEEDDKDTIIDTEQATEEDPRITIDEYEEDIEDDESVFDRKNAQIWIKLCGGSIAVGMLLWRLQYGLDTGLFIHIQGIMCCMIMLLSTMILLSPRNTKKCRKMWLGILFAYIMVLVVEYILAYFWWWGAGVIFECIAFMAFSIVMIRLPKLRISTIRWWAIAAAAASLILFGDYCS